MGEQTGTRLNRRSAACKFPSESIRKQQLLRPRRIKKNLSLNLKPFAIFMAVSLIIILISGTALFWSGVLWIDYGMYSEFSFERLPGFLVIILAEISMLGAGWKIFSEIREYDKTKTSSTLIGEERIFE